MLLNQQVRESSFFSGSHYTEDYNRIKRMINFTINRINSDVLDYFQKVREETYLSNLFFDLMDIEKAMMISYISHCKENNLPIDNYIKGFLK